MGLITVNEVKTILDTSGSSSDNRIEMLIPIVEDFIQHYCFSNFYSGSLTLGNQINFFESTGVLYGSEQVFPPGLKLAAAQMINFQLNSMSGNIASEGIGAYSVSYSTTYPDTILAMLNPFRKVKFT